MPFFDAQTAPPLTFSVPAGSEAAAPRPRAKKLNGAGRTDAHPSPYIFLMPRVPSKQLNANSLPTVQATGPFGTRSLRQPPEQPRRDQSAGAPTRQHPRSPIAVINTLFTIISPLTRWHYLPTWLSLST